MSESAPKSVWQVSDLTKQIAQLLDRHVGSVQLMGEISNWNVAGSGHRRRSDTHPPTAHAAAR